MPHTRTEEVNQTERGNTLNPLKEDHEEHQTLIDDLLNAPVSLLKNSEDQKISVMDLPTRKPGSALDRIKKKREEKNAHKPTSPMDLANDKNFSSKEDNTRSPHLISCNIQTAVDEYTQEELENISKDELAIKVRLRDLQFLMKEFSGLKEEFEKNKTISLDQYREYIKKFQDSHFPAICNENKSVVTSDQNPFPENGLDLEHVTKKQLDAILDKFDVLVEQETNALTYLSIRLKETTENHFRISFINMQNVGKKTEEEVMVQNQKT